MSCRAVPSTIAMSALALCAVACGIKGPPKPPLPRAPEPPRRVVLRQSGPDLEVSWIEPERRQNELPIEEPLTYEVRALVAERPALPPSPVPAVSPPAPPAGGSAPASGVPQPPQQQPPQQQPPPPSEPGPQPQPILPPSSPSVPAPPAPVPTRSGGRLFGDDDDQGMRRAEETFLTSSTIVATVQGRPRSRQASRPVPAGTETSSPGGRAKHDTTEGGAAGPVAEVDAPGAGREPPRVAGAASPDRARRAGRERPSRLEMRIGPDRFPAARLSNARVEVAIVAVDARGRRSPPRPILQIDPVEALPALASFSAQATPEGVRLGWTIPPLSSGALPVRVNVYRSLGPPVETGAAAASPSGGVAERAAAGASDDASPELIRGSPFSGDGALDSDARIGERYRYVGRLVHVGPGSGLREGPPSAPVIVDTADRFPPAAPGLVTADAVEPGEGHPDTWAVRIAWSPPIDADVAAYRVHRADADGDFQVVASVPSGETQWLDTTVSPGKRYRYFVTAIDAASPPNESLPSETVETTPAAPDRDGAAPTQGEPRSRWAKAKS